MDAAIKLIKEFEGLRTKAYVPPEGTARGHAIGYGYTRSFVTKDCVISELWAAQLLREDLKIISAVLVNLIEKKLSPNQFSAVLSFVYNVGLGKFKASTMLRLLNKGNFLAAANEFSRWVNINGKVSDGLVRRRLAEKNLFQTPDESAT